VFYLAKILSLEQFGIYSYILASVSICTYLAGLDFYAYSHRCFLKKSINLNQLTKAQLQFLGISVTTVAIISAVLSSKVLKGYLYYFPFLIAGECITNEIIRLQSVCEMATSSNVTNFLKSAFWMIGVILTRYYKVGVVLDQVFQFWIIGLLVAIVWSIKTFPVKINQIFEAEVPKDFFKRSVSIIARILVGTIAIRSLFSIDRIYVDFEYGSMVAGVYGFFVSLSSALLAILDALYFNRLFPPLIKMAGNDYAEATKLSLKMEVNSLLIGVLALTSYVLVGPILFDFIGKSEMINFQFMGFLLIASYILYAVSLGPNCLLYAIGKDKLVSLIHLAGLLVFISFIFCSHETKQLNFIFFGLFFSMIVIYTLKKYYSSIVNKA
jgi:hypothetical protein